MPEFLKKYPDIHIEIVVESRFVDIVAGSFDAGIRLLSDVQRDMIAIKLSSDIRFVAVASPAYLKRHTPPDIPQDLLNHECIKFRFDSGRLYRWELIKDELSFTMDVDGPMTLGNTNLMREAALAGIGIAWLPEPLVKDDIDTGKLVALLMDWSPMLSSLCLYYPANRHPPMAFQLFTQELRKWVYNTGLLK